MFVIVFRSSYEGAGWHFVAAYSQYEAGAAGDAADAFKQALGRNCEVKVFLWEWSK